MRVVKASVNPLSSGGASPGIDTTFRTPSTCRARRDLLTTTMYGRVGSKAQQRSGSVKTRTQGGTAAQAA